MYPTGYHGTEEKKNKQYNTLKNDILVEQVTLFQLQQSHELFVNGRLEKIAELVSIIILIWFEKLISLS